METNGENRALFLRENKAGLLINDCMSPGYSDTRRYSFRLPVSGLGIIPSF